MKRRPAMRVKVEIVVDHGVHRIASLCIKERQRRRNRGPSPRAACLRERDQTWMKRFAAEQGFEVAYILGNDDAILGEAVVFDSMVELTAPADMQRMDRVMAELCEVERKFGRKAFVDK